MQASTAVAERNPPGHAPNEKTSRKHLPRSEAELEVRTHPEELSVTEFTPDDLHEESTAGSDSDFESGRRRVTSNRNDPRYHEVPGQSRPRRFTSIERTAAQREIRAISDRLQDEFLLNRRKYRKRIFFLELGKNVGKINSDPSTLLQSNVNSKSMY
jgi:hypothetical protein